MSDDLDPRLEGTLETSEAFAIDSPEIWALASAAARVDERSAYRENGRPTMFVGGASRCATLLERLIERGLANPNVLLASATKSPEVVDVLLRLARPTQADVDTALLACCDVYSYDPIVAVFERFLLAHPSQTALDEALLRAAKGTERYRGVILDVEFFDVFDALLAAGANPDRAIHALVALGGVGKRVKRADATIERAIAKLSSVDVTDEHGRTALHVACIQALPTRIAMLLAAGADRDRRDAEGKTPIDYAPPVVYDALGLPPPPPPPPRARPKPKQPLVPAPAAPDPFAVGTRVTHAKFGEGTVVASIGEGPSRKLTIDFAGTQRTLAASFVTTA